MPITIRCRSCNAKVRVPRRMAGKGFCCPMCGKANVAPMAEPTPSAPAALVVGKVKTECSRCATRIRVTVEPATPPDTKADTTLVVQCCLCGTYLRAKVQFGATTPRKKKLPRPRSAQPAQKAGPVRPAPAPQEDLDASPFVLDDPGETAARKTDRTAPGGSRPYLTPVPAVAPVTSNARKRPPEPFAPQERDQLGGGGAGFGLIVLAVGVLGLGLTFVPDLQGLALAGGGLGLLLGLVALTWGFWEDHNIGLALTGSAVSVLALVLGWVMNSRGEPTGQVARQQWPPSREARWTAVDPSEWIDANRNVLRQGRAQVRVHSAVLRWADVKSAKGKQQKQPRAVSVVVRIDHVGRRGTLSYTTWGQTSRQPASLRDEAGIAYPPAEPSDPTDVKGRVANVSLPPGDYLRDTLVFLPPSGPRPLRLELPGEAVGQSEPFRLEIPVEMLLPGGR